MTKFFNTPVRNVGGTLTRAEVAMDALARWTEFGKPGPAHRWLGWSAEEWQDFEEYGAFPYPRKGAL